MSATLRDLTNQVAGTFRYNLQTLPDTLLAAILLFALFFQSAALATFGISLLVHGGLYQVFASFLGRNIPGLRRPTGSSRCTGRFPSISYLGAATQAANTINSMNGSNNNGATYSDTEWPSYYASFMGFFLGYVGTLPFIYKEELAASPQRTISTTGGLVIGAIVLLMSVVFRLSSGCDDILGVVAGLVIGGIMGFTLVSLISYASDRSLTNVLALPLFTGVASSGKPIYVCAPAK